MKKLFILFLLFATSYYKAQVYPSSCNKLDTITNFYLEDAKKLNFRFIHRSGNTYKDSAALNPTVTNNFQKALLAVYNATAIPAVDTIVRMLKIHCYGTGLHSLLLQVDTNQQWLKNIRANITPTGNYTVDSIMAKHYLYKFAYANAFNLLHGTLVLKSDTAFNAPALGRFFLKFPEVNMWDYEDYGGDGPNIEDTVNTNFHWLRYSYGWVDCSNGCIFHRYWQFRVYNDCSVEYGGSYGFPLNVGIKQNAIVFENLKAYPNPTNSKLNLDGLPVKAKISLINILGEEVYSGNSPAVSTTLDLSAYADGIYYLRIKNAAGQQIIKVIKN